MLLSTDGIFLPCSAYSVLGVVDGFAFWVASFSRR